MAPSKKKSKSPTKAAATAAAATSASASASSAKLTSSSKSTSKQPKQTQQPVSTRPKRQVPEKRFYDELEDERPQHLSTRGLKKKKGGIRYCTVLLLLSAADGRSVFCTRVLCCRFSRRWYVVGSLHRVPLPRLNSVRYLQLHTAKSNHPRAFHSRPRPY